MVRTPERKVGFPSGYPGVGVVERAAMSSARKLVDEAFLLLPSQEDMFGSRWVLSLLQRNIVCHMDH